MSEDRPARPWDIFNANKRHMPSGVAEKRMAICQSCPEYIRLTKMCSICHCIMPAKVLINDAECPIRNWKKVVYSITDPEGVLDDGLPSVNPDIP